MRSHRVRRSVILGAATLLTLVAISALAQGAPGPAEIGSWTAPFEEGGSSPACWTGTDGRIHCKPTAVGAAVLPDGRVLYMNAIESSENVQYGAPPALAPESRDALSRILDLRGGTPVFSIPTPETGGASNPNITPGSNGLDDPLGVLGVPGRPGDGLFGSYWGQLGLPPHDPTSPPDDVQKNDGDLFCSDQVMLSDGRLLITGGTDWYNEPAVIDRDTGGPVDIGIVELEGLRNSRIFNPADDTYTQVGNMRHGRWYPSEVTLANGKVFIVGGVTKLIKSTQGSQVLRSETFDPATNKWTENYTGPASEKSLPLFPRVFLLPTGKIFYTGVGQTWGPLGQAVDELTWGQTSMWNPATKTWEDTFLTPTPFFMIGGAPVVMRPLVPPYNSAELVILGGTRLPTPGSYFATNLIETIKLFNAGGSQYTQLVGPVLKHRRWFGSAVTLPDGKIFLTNGADKDEVLLPGTEIAQRVPELVNMDTGTSRNMALAARDRTYHNSALLLPDGRVLVGGHSPIGALYGAQHDLIPGVTANNDKDPSFEVFSPPYLYWGARPQITGVQKGITWGAANTFTVTTPDAANVSQVVLSRLPSPQHITDTDARTVRLAFTKGSGSLTVTPPPNGNVAPPGYYYLFLLKKYAKGLVPSVARVVHVGSTTDTDPTSNVYTTTDPNNPPAPSGGSASPVYDSSYLAKPPPPLGALAVGMVAAGAAVPAARRKRLPGEPLED